MEYVKKAALGYRVTAQNDPECAYVVLSFEELRALKEEHERKLMAEREQASETLKKTQAAGQKREVELETERDKLEQELEEEKAESAYQKGLNENLLRMARERANAARELQPKKEHSGYCVLTSDERAYRFKDRYRDYHEIPFWETRIQSPWSVEMPQSQVRELLEHEIMVKIGGKLGLEFWCSDGFEKLLTESEWEERRETSNIMFGFHLRADYSRGYWEFFLQHTKPFENVPENMRKGKRTGKNTGGTA